MVGGGRCTISSSQHFRWWYCEWGSWFSCCPSIWKKCRPHWLIKMLFFSVLFNWIKIWVLLYLSIKKVLVHLCLIDMISCDMQTIFFVYLRVPCFPEDEINKKIIVCQLNYALSCWIIFWNKFHILISWFLELASDPWVIIYWIYNINLELQPFKIGNIVK